MFNINKTLSTTIAILAIFGTSTVSAEGFKITSTSFEDNAVMDRKFAGKGGPRKCDGENISPAFSWENAPEGTKSFAIYARDAVGRGGLGVDHWLLYNIPASVTGFAEGEVPAGTAQGKNITGKSAYLGPCPDVGDQPHHYEFMIVPLDLEPDALKEDLTGSEFLKAIDGHATSAATSMIGRYSRSK